jgi:hypothetical protein
MNSDEDLRVTLTIKNDQDSTAGTVAEGNDDCAMGLFGKEKNSAISNSLSFHMF